MGCSGPCGLRGPFDTHKNQASGRGLDGLVLGQHPGLVLRSTRRPDRLQRRVHALSFHHDSLAFPAL